MKTPIYLLLSLLFCAFSVFGYPAKVVGIADGDTCTVLTAENQQVKIRLAGIDTPETSQAFGTKAKQALSDKIFGQTVEVKAQTKDRYGRTVAEGIGNPNAVRERESKVGRGFWLGKQPGMG